MILGLNPNSKRLKAASKYLTNTNQCAILPFVYFLPCKSRIAEKKNEGHFEELPLSVLRERHATPVLKRFLEDEVIAKQSGRPHPQSADPEMRLYKIFVTNKEISGLAACYPIT